MKLHKNAALTLGQRQQIQQLYATRQFSYPQLAAQFNTTPATIRKWVKREDYQDQSSAPKNHYRRVTDAYRQAVIDYRLAHPHHGPVRIEQELRSKYGPFAFSTVRLILDQSLPPKPKRPLMHPLATGRYRTQMDVQQLPALTGKTGFEYKISIIHLATRIKYSEIHDDYESATIAEVFKRSMDVLPPFLSPSPTTP